MSKNGSINQKPVDVEEESKSNDLPICRSIRTSVISGDASLYYKRRIDLEERASLYESYKEQIVAECYINFAKLL
jgi:hypothetical protein